MQLRRLAAAALAFLLGTVVALLLAELGLRLLGAAFLWQREHAIKPGGPGVITILCLGESSTAVGGPISYPSQLEAELNRRARALRYRVVNRAFPSTNSNSIVHNLPKDLAEVRPDIVTVMMGINDDNPGFARAAAHPESDPTRAPDALDQLKTVRLARFLLLQRGPQDQDSANRAAAVWAS